MRISLATAGNHPAALWWTPVVRVPAVGTIGTGAIPATRWRHDFREPAGARLGLLLAALLGRAPGYRAVVVRTLAVVAVQCDWSRKRTTSGDVLSNPNLKSGPSGQRVRVDSSQQKSINALTLGG